MKGYIKWICETLLQSEYIEKETIGLWIIKRKSNIIKEITSLECIEYSFCTQYQLTIFDIN